MPASGSPPRQELVIEAGADHIAAWLFPAPKPHERRVPGPAIVMAHGLGGTREMKLDEFAAEFQALGYTTVVFDYRCHGDSSGSPRHLVDWAAQQEDWRTVIAYARTLPDVDPERIGLFGTSFSGGHVIQLGAQDARIKAIVSQCPFTDGLRSAFTPSASTLPRLVWLGLRDALFGTAAHPITVPLVAKPGEVALMNSHDALDGFSRIQPSSLRNDICIPARLVMNMPLLRPGASAGRVSCPILFALCAHDTVAPVQASLSYAKRAPQGIVKWYNDMGHFDIYVGDKHERAFRDYAEFLHENLPLA